MIIHLINEIIGDTNIAGSLKENDIFKLNFELSLYILFIANVTQGPHQHKKNDTYCKRHGRESLTRVAKCMTINNSCKISLDRAK